MGILYLQSANTNEIVAATVSQQDTANANSQIDNEVSQINETKELEKSIDLASIASNAQVFSIVFLTIFES